MEVPLSLGHGSGSRGPVSSSQVGGDDVAPARTVARQARGAIAVQKSQEWSPSPADSRASGERMTEPMAEAFLVLGPGGRFSYVSGRAAQLLGSSAEDLLGRGLWDVLPVAGRTHVREAYERAVLTQQRQTTVCCCAGGRRSISLRLYPSVEGVDVFLLEEPIANGDPELDASAPDALQSRRAARNWCGTRPAFSTSSLPGAR